MKSILPLIFTFAFLLSTHAATPIPADSEQFMDFRGHSNFTSPEVEKLYQCKTYEELLAQLEKAIASLTPAPGFEFEDAAHVDALGTCKLARIRTLYLVGQIKKADELLSEYHPVNAS